jgi:hypothetical protein
MVAGFAVVVALASGSGCGLGPRNFRKIKHPAPLVRARAMSLGDRQSDSRVIPALVERLADSDPVVRLVAHEELRRRTGRDFGYFPWASPEDRAGAISRWHAWLAGGRDMPAATSPRRSKNQPKPSPQGP